MSATELVTLALSSGVLVQGIAALRWCVRIESRVEALEAKRAAA